MPSKASHSTSFRDSVGSEVGAGSKGSGSRGLGHDKDALNEDRRKSREFLGHCLDIALDYTQGADLVQQCVKHSRDRKAYSAAPPVGDPALGAYAALCEQMREFVVGRVQCGSVGKWSEAFVRKHAVLVDSIVYCFRFTFLSAVELAMQRGDFRHNELSLQHNQGLTRERWVAAKKSSVIIRSFYHSCMRHQLLKIKLGLPVLVQEGMLRKASKQWLAIATHKGKPLLLAYRSNRLSLEAFIWKMNLSKELVVSKIGTTHCDLVSGVGGISRLGKKKLGFHNHADQRRFLLELRQLCTNLRFKWNALQKKEQLEGHYNEATPETRTFALRGKLPRETFVLKLHSLSGLSSVGNLKNSRIYTTVSFGNGPSHVLPEREGVEGYDPRLGSDLVVLDQTVCETIFHSHSMSEGDIFITLHVRPSSSTIFRTATVHVPYYDVRRKDFLINIPIPVFSGDMDTGGECVLRISAFSVQGPLAGHSEGPTPRRDTLNDDVPSRVDQSRTVFSQTLLQQHRHLFDALAAYDPVDSLDWTLDAIRGDVFRKHAFQIPYIATPMGAPFISSFLSIFGHAWFKRYRDRGQRGFASGVGGLAATIFHSANFENVSERLVLGKVPASYEQSKIDVAFVRVLHGFYLERTNRIKGMFVQSQSHLCVEVSVIDMSSNRRPSVAVAGHGRLDTAEAGLDEPLIGPVAAKIGSLTHAFNQTYCLHLGATGNGAGYDSLAVRIRVLNRDSLDHLQVVGGTIMPLVGDERSVVAGAKTPLEQVLIWNEQALLMQEDNLRKNRAQFTLVDATKFVGVLQVHLEVQERSGKRNVPNETLIPYSSFSQYCSALSDQLDAENLLQHELVHSPAEHNAAQNLYTSSSTILAALKETRPIKVTYEKLQGDKILIPTTIPTKFAARHSLVLSDYKLYVRCGNDHFEINLAAYKLEVSDFSKLATAQSTTFSITVIDRNDLQIGSVVVADGNEGKHGGNSKSAASGDEAKTKSKHPHDLSFVRRTGGFMRFIISATDGRALDFTQQASHTTDIKIWHDIVAEAAAFFDFSAANDLGYTAIADATNPTQKMMFKQRHLRMRSLLAHGIRQYLALCRLMSKHSDLDLLPDSRGVMDVLVFYSAANRDDKLIGMGAQALQDHIEPLLHEGLKYGIIPFTLCPLSTSFRSLLRHPSHDEVVADEDPIGSPGLDGETMTESDRFPSAEQILRLHESRTWCNTVAQDKVAKGGPFLSVGHSSRGLQRPRVSSQPALGMEPDGPKPYGLSMPCFWHFRRKSVHLTAILKGAWADYKSMVDVREHDRNRTKFNQMQDNLPYQISIITAIVVSFQQTTKQGLKAFSGLMSWKSPLRSLLFLWVVEYALYMGFLKILVPVVLAGLAFGMYRNVRKVQFTSLVIPEEKKQSVKEFFNTLKEIPAIMDEVQSTLQMINITLLKLRAVQTGCYVGDPGARLTLSYVVVAILLVVGFLLIWVPIYLIVMVVFAIMLRGYYADPTPIVTAAKSLYDSVPLADFKRVDE